MAKGKIQIVDDEKNIVEALRYNLDREGFETVVAYDGLVALEQAQRELPDLIVLDWMLPGIDGLEVCRRLSAHESTRHIPVLMLTVRSDETDKVLGLEMGADDYMTKPFGTRELVARVKALLRRRPEAVPASLPECFELEGLRVDWSRHRATLDGKTLELTSKEFHLLKALVEAEGRVLSRERLLDVVWGYEHAESVGTRTVDLHVSQLRKKLANLAARLVTVKNAGYRFDQEGGAGAL